MIAAIGLEQRRFAVLVVLFYLSSSAMAEEEDWSKFQNCLEINGAAKSEEWMLVAQGNRLNPTSVSTKFAVSTGRTFRSRLDRIIEAARLGALGSDGNAAAIVQDEHLDIRLDYFCSASPLGSNTGGEAEGLQDGGSR